MSAQPSLFGDPPAERSTLGPRQQLILTAVREGGLTDDEAGALVHAARGKHATDVRCMWCADEGRNVLGSLRKRGLVTRRQGGQWEPRGVKAQPEGESSQGQDIGF